MPIRVGTDCSGMETPIMALKALGVSHLHEFSCDKDKHVRATIMANSRPKMWYDDVMQRNNKEAPEVDLYIAGFPCQPFSSAGLQEGFNDKHGRGEVFWHVRDYIAKKQPRVFVLENVQGLARAEKGTYKKAIMESLEALRLYNIYEQLLDTIDHGVPQSRPRIYIVGILKAYDKGTFAFPEKLPRVSVEEFLDPRKGRPNEKMLPPRTQTTAHANVKRIIRELQKLGHDPFKECWVLDVDSTANWTKKRLGSVPCMTCARGKGHWLTNRGRRMNKSEMMRLQGMPTPEDGFVVAVSEAQLGKQIGNAMSCNVLERLFCRALPAAGLVRQNAVVDRWEIKAKLRAAQQNRKALDGEGVPAPSTPPAKRKTVSDPMSPFKRRRVV